MEKKYKKNTKEKIESLLKKEDKEKILNLITALQPYDLAEIVKNLEHKQQLTLISLLKVKDSAEILEYLEPELQYKILQHLPHNILTPLLKQISSDIIVDMLLAIHPLQAEKLLNLLPIDYREKINKLMTYPEDTAGSIMTVDFISGREYWTGEQTINHIRKIGRKAELISYIYVTDMRGELVGVVSLKEIILANPKTCLKNIAKTDVISVPAEMEQEEVANIISKYNFYALPVVDYQNRLIGIITYDDIAEVIQEETTEDFQKLGGSQPLTEPYFKTTTLSLFKKRIMWLLILFLGGAYTSSVLAGYKTETEKEVALSFFIPLLIGTGGNTGSQIITTLIRALGVGEIKFKDIFRIVKKEIFTGFLLGTSLGIVGYSWSYIMHVNTNVGYVVALSALFIVLWSSFVAAILPLILNKLKIDPALVSGPLISTLVDGTGLIIYFTIAKNILRI